MAKVLTGISGNLISAASAGFAPTNSADVSAIASAYQVVSATATQLYAGTAYVTSVNGAPLSASRAGNAANASLASSAWYDGTGRLISALPDSASVSAIASAYAESAASSKQDELTFSYDDDKISAINGSALAGQGGGGSVASPSGTIIVTDGTAIEATNSAIGSSTVEQKFLNYAPNESQISNWQSTVLLQGVSVSGASLMKLQALANHYTLTASAVYSAIISGLPIGGGGELVGSASATSYGSSMEFNFPLDPSWGFGSIWASSQYYNLYLNTADNNAIAFYSASTSSGVKELAWKDDIPAPIDLGIYENIYHDKYVSSINSIPVSAKWAGSANYANYAYTAEQDPFGRNLSALADKTSVPTGISSPNGTIIANGFNVEATNSAVTTTVVPGYATTVVGNTAQLRPDTPVACTLPSANENSKLFFQLDYGADMTVSAVYDGITATASAGAGAPEVVLDVPNATTVSLYGSWYRYMLGSASASAADYLAPGSIGELAWASALPTYEYDAEDKISAINGSAIAGGAGGGVDSATVSAIASSYAESAVSSYQPLSGMSGYASAFSAGEGLEFVQSGSDQVLQVEAPVDIVAGPGIVIDNPDGNTLRVSTDENYETVLFEGTAATSVTCSEAITNFELLKVYVTPAAVTTDTMIQIVEMVPGKFGSYMMLAGYQSNLFHIYGGRIANSGTTTLKTENGFHMWVPITSGGSVGNESSNSKIAKVVGIRRIANN